MEDRRWATVVGAWGDIFAGLGNIKAVLEPDEKVNILYYGKDEDIVAFLSSQDFIDTVAHARPHPTNYWQEIKILCAEESGFNVNRWLPWLAGRAGIAVPEDVIVGQITVTKYRYGTIQRWHNAALPDGYDVMDKVRSLSNGKPIVLLNPYSTQSSGLVDHWPYWEEAMAALCRNTDIFWLQVGIGGEDTWQNDGSFYLKTPSALNVLSLMEQADATITTSNSLSMWSIIQQTKTTLVGCNKITSDPRKEHNYYGRWINHAPNIIIKHQESLNSFISAWKYIERQLN